MIGIVTPYGRGSTTSAAIRLADVALARGADVRLVAFGRRESNVHPFWDSCVWSSKADGIYYAAKGCTQFVHFRVNKRLLEMTKLVAEDAGHILVPPWHSLTLEDGETCKLYDKIVCPSKVYNHFFREHIRDKDVSWCRWESGLPPVKRDGLVNAGRVSACFYCDSNTIDFCGPMVIELISELLKSLPKLDVGVLSAKSWGRRDRTELSRLKKVYNSRLGVCPVGNLFEQATHFHHYDWLVYPAVRTDFCMVPAMALSCGLPVIAHDLPPLDELLTNDHSGVLVGCEIKTGVVRAPLAVPCYGKWLDACLQAFSDNRKLFSMQQKEWGLERAQWSFNEFWSKLLGV